MLYDVARYLDFAMFGVGCAFMFITNVLAFKMLRTPRKFGFLWWHVTTVSLSFLCLGTTSLVTIFSNIGVSATWETLVRFSGFLLFMLSQMLIFSIELQRYANRLALDQAASMEM